MVDISSNEIIIAILFLLPGFLFISLICKISVYNHKKIGDQGYYLLSLFFSLLFFVVSMVVENIPYVKQAELNPDYKLVILIYAFSVILGILIGFILKVIFHGDLKPSQHSTWLVSLKELNEHKGEYVHIFTSNQLEFRGKILRFSWDDDPYREIHVTNSSLIIRDNDFKIIRKNEIGSEMIFTQQDIMRISFHEPLLNDELFREANSILKTKSEKCAIFDFVKKIFK